MPAWLLGAACSALGATHLGLVALLWAPPMGGVGQPLPPPILRRVRWETADVLNQDERCPVLANTGRQFRFHKLGIVVLEQQAQLSVTHRANDYKGQRTAIPFACKSLGCMGTISVALMLVRAHHRCHAEYRDLAAG